MTQRHKYNRSALLTLSLLLAAGHASTGFTQAPGNDATRAAARSLGEQGIEAYWANDFAGADAKLDQAYRLYPTPTLALWSARARAGLGRWVEAAERYRDAGRASDALGESAKQKEAQRDALKELNELAPRVPSLTVQLAQSDRSGIQILLDGEGVPTAMIGARRPTNRGKHKLVVTRGAERFETSFELLEKQHKVIPVELRPPQAPAPGVAVVPSAPAKGPVPAPAPAPSALQRPAPQPPPSAAPGPSDARSAAAQTPAASEPTSHAEVSPPSVPAAADSTAPASSDAFVRPLAITALAVGGAGLIASAVASLAAGSALDECPEKVCTTKSDKDSYETLKSVATVTFYTGAVLAVGGLATLLLHSSSPSSTGETPPDQLAWSVSPAGVSVQGSF